MSRSTLMHKIQHSIPRVTGSLDEMLEGADIGQVALKYEWAMGVEDEEPHQLMFRDAVEKACAAILTDREREILSWRYCGDLTLEATGQKFNPPISRERVRQIEEWAMCKLRAQFRELGVTNARR